jgi:AAA domain/DnaB-like helicase N terminal domain
MSTQPVHADLEAEAAVLGAALMDNAVYCRLTAFLKPDHFANAVHGRIYAAIGELIGRCVPADAITIKDALGDDLVLTPLGGMGPFLAKLIDAAVAPAFAEHYARIILRCCIRRRVIDAATAGAPLEDVAALAREAESAAPAKLTFTQASSLAGKTPPERPWLVEGWVPRRQVTLLSGDGGVGKSLIAMMLQIAAEAGCPWLALPIRPCGSLGFYGEDDEDELHRRLITLCELMGVDVAVLERMFWRSTIMDDAELIEPDERGTVRPTAYFHEIERQAIARASRLVVLDAATNFYGGDELNRRQVNAFLRLLHRFAVAIDGAVLLLAHPSLAGIASGSGLSGSTHWNNAVRSRLYLAASKGEDADPAERTLTKVKANYASIGDVLRLRWQGGGFIALDPPGTVDRVALASKADRVFRSLLNATYAAGIWVSANPSSRNYAPRIFADRPDREGLGEKAFKDALFRLDKAGAIRTETYGRPSDPHTRLAPA